MKEELGMTGDAVRQLLAEISAKEKAATDGWELEPEQASDNAYRPAKVTALGASDYWSGESDEYTIASGAPGDMAFIADARSSVPRLVAALTAVLDHIETVRGTGRQSDIVLAVEFEAAIAAELTR